MAISVGQATDYAEYLKKYDKDLQGVSRWEKTFLQPAQQYYQTQAQAVSAQTEYDISEAYQHYLKTQRSLLQNRQLASGFKEQLGESALSAYESAYAKSKAQEASSLYDITKKYTETLAEEDERLKGLGEQLANLESKIYEYARIDAESAKAAYGTIIDDETGQTGLGHWSINPETGETQLTARGSDFIQQMLYGEKSAGPEGFASYLVSNEENELLEFYRNNQDLVNVVFGLKEGQRSVDEEISKLVKEEEKEEVSSLTENEMLLENIAKIPYDEFSQIKEKVSLFPDTYVGTISNYSEMRGDENTYNLYGEQYKVVDRFHGYTKDGLKKVQEINQALGPNNRKIRVGDVIQVKGKLYIVAGKNSLDEDGAAAGFFEIEKE